jgi:hypothetical protein
LHSLTGCDSTSRLFGIGKGIVLKRLNQLQWLLTIKHNLRLFVQ